VTIVRVGFLGPLSTSKGAWGATVSCLSQVGGGVLAAQRFSCILRSSGGLFCYAKACIQLQKSLSLAARGVMPFPWRARNYMCRGNINYDTGLNPRQLAL